MRSLIVLIVLCSYLVFVNAIIDLTRLNTTQGMTLCGVTFSISTYQTYGSTGTEQHIGSPCDVNGDGINDVLLGSHLSSLLGRQHAGVTFILFGTPTLRPNVDLKNLSRIEGFIIVGSVPYDAAGYSVACAGDVNGDRVDDIIIGAPVCPYCNDPGDWSLRGPVAYVVLGNREEFPDIFDLATVSENQLVRLVSSSSSTFGREVSSVGDVNSDGFADFFLGGATGGPPCDSFIVYGKASFSGNLTVPFASPTDGIRIVGGEWGCPSGVSRQQGDINADNITDLVFSRYGSSEVIVVYGTKYPPPIVDLDFLDALEGSKTVGLPLTDNDLNANLVKDFNGDGIDDLVIGINTAKLRTGAVYVVYGRKNFPARINVGTMAPSEGIRIMGGAESNYFGTTVGSVHDINGDGLADVVVGAPNYPWIENGGTSFVIFGGASSMTVANLLPSQGFIFSCGGGEDSGDVVANVGDVNAGGVDDIAISATGALNGTGAIFVIFGEFLQSLAPTRLPTVSPTPIPTAQASSPTSTAALFSTLLPSLHPSAIMATVQPSFQPYSSTSIEPSSSASFQPSSSSKSMQLSFFTTFLSSMQPSVFSQESTISTVSDSQPLLPAAMTTITPSTFTAVTSTPGATTLSSTDLPTSSLPWWAALLIVLLCTGIVLLAVLLALRRRQANKNDIERFTTLSTDMALANSTRFSTTPMSLASFPPTYRGGSIVTPQRSFPSATAAVSGSTTIHTNSKGRKKSGSVSQKAPRRRYSTTVVERQSFAVAPLHVYDRLSRPFPLFQTMSNYDVADLQMVRDRFNVHAADLNKIAVIGSGNFGVVFKGRWRGMDVAIKEVRNEQSSSVLVDEAMRMKDLRPHLNVVLLYGVCEFPLSIVTQLCIEVCALDALLYGPTASTFTTQQLRDIARGAAAGVAHLHAEAIVHRDLAARNILIDANDTPKIADFGMSRPESAASVATTQTLIEPIKWMAPEQLLAQQYSTASDIFSFGVVLFEIFARQPPWANLSNAEAAQNVISGNFLQLPDGSPPDVSEAMTVCFATTPSLRPPISALINRILESSP